MGLFGSSLLFSRCLLTDSNPTRLGQRPHLPDPRRARASALVLVPNDEPPDGALGQARDAGRGEGTASEELGRLEGMDRPERNALRRLR
jgi:hypothetical protein